MPSLFKPSDRKYRSDKYKSNIQIRVGGFGVQKALSKLTQRKGCHIINVLKTVRKMVMRGKQCLSQNRWISDPISGNTLIWPIMARR